MDLNTRPQWKTAQAPVGAAVTEMNRLEREGCDVVHVFPILVARDPKTNVAVTEIFIAAVKR